MQCDAVHCSLHAVLGRSLLPEVQHSAAHCSARCSAAQCSALPPGAQCSAVQCIGPQDAAQCPLGCSAVCSGVAQCIAPCSAGQCTAPWCAAQCSASLPWVQGNALHCSPRCIVVQHVAPRGAVKSFAAPGSALLLGVQHGVVHCSWRCSIARCIAPGDAARCSALLPRVQHAVHCLLERGEGAVSAQRDPLPTQQPSLRWGRCSPRVTLGQSTPGRGEPGRSLPPSLHPSTAAGTQKTIPCCRHLKWLLGSSGVEGWGGGEGGVGCRHPEIRGGWMDGWMDGDELYDFSFFSRRASSQVTYFHRLRRRRRA